MATAIAAGVAEDEKERKLKRNVDRDACEQKDSRLPLSRPRPAARPPTSRHKSNTLATSFCAKDPRGSHFAPKKIFMPDSFGCNGSSTEAQPIYLKRKRRQSQLDQTQLRQRFLCH